MDSLPQKPGEEWPEVWVARNDAPGGLVLIADTEEAEQWRSIGRPVRRYAPSSASPQALLERLAGELEDEIAQRLREEAEALAKDSDAAPESCSEPPEENRIEAAALWLEQLAEQAPFHTAVAKALREEAEGLGEDKASRRESAVMELLPPESQEGRPSFASKRPKDAARERLEEAAQIALDAGIHSETAEGIVSRVASEKGSE